MRVLPDQQHLLAALYQAVSEHPGDAPVVVHVENMDGIDDIALAPSFSVEPGPGLERTVEALLGAGSYRVETRRDRAPEPQPAWSSRRT